MRSKAEPEHEKIARFMATGAFHPETLFYKSERKGNGGWKYWYMLCGECGAMGESEAMDLLKGARSCECPRARQKQSYINIIYNEQDTPVALKFGIANIAGNRVDSQNVVNALKCRQFDVFQFETKMSCLAAEREVKSKVERKFLSKDVFPDGWTETTDIKNLDSIIKIYKKHGGVSIMHIVNDTWFDGCVAFVEVTMFGTDLKDSEVPYFSSRNETGRLL